MKKIDLLSIHSLEFVKFGWVLAKPDCGLTIETDHVRQWFSVAPMNGFQRKQTISYFETKKVPVECDRLECIFDDDEAYINIDDSRLVIFVALSKPDHDEIPDEGTLKAFLIPPGESIIIKKKVWHWAPYPLDHDNKFLLLLAERIYKYHGEELWINNEHVIFKDLEEKYTIALG